MAKKLAGKSSTSRHFVYLFGRKTDGNGTMKPLLGGKGANLAEMCRIGLPVPPGFTITTEVCTYYYANKRSYPAALRGQMDAGVASIEQQTGKKFGDLKNPLLVSVRSGARDSMPGMMDTILNLGLNDDTVEALAKKTANPREPNTLYVAWRGEQEGQEGRALQWWLDQLRQPRLAQRLVQGLDLFAR